MHHNDSAQAPSMKWAGIECNFRAEGEFEESFEKYIVTYHDIFKIHTGEKLNQSSQCDAVSYYASPLN